MTGWQNYSDEGDRVAFVIKGASSSFLPEFRDILNDIIERLLR